MTRLTNINLAISQELLTTLDEIAEFEEVSRNALIEQILWKSQLVRTTAAGLDIQKPAPRRMGRPRKKEQTR